MYYLVTQTVLELHVIQLFVIVAAIADFIMHYFLDQITQSKVL